jgi:hypothetical protein
MRRYFPALLLIIFFAGCASTPELTALQRRSFEARDLQGSFEDAFKATIQVLQDEGYVIKNADFQSGVIQGETGIKQDFWGGTMHNAEVTATLEQFGENTVKERLVFLNKSKDSSRYGTFEDSKRIEDPKFFQRIYDDIQKEMFVRKNLSK